jgi:hypothetical protein
MPKSSIVENVIGDVRVDLILISPHDATYGDSERPFTGIS